MMSVTGRIRPFPSLVGYQSRWLRGDLIAGLTVWAVLIPESLAYATIAGVSPVVGLSAAVPALVLYAALGSSRHLIVAPMSGTAALSASIVGGLAAAGSAAYVAHTVGLALVVAVLGVVAGLCKLGFLANFISEPVLKGFIVGLALTIIIGQVPALIGVKKPPGSFFEKFWGIVTELGSIHGLTLLIGVVALALILLLRTWLPLIPGALLVVVLGIAAVAVFGLDRHGVEIVGHIDAGLPSLGLPDLTWDDYLSMAGPGVGVLLIGFAEGLGAAKTYAAKAGYEIDPNRELLGMGASNLGAGVMNGMVVNGSLSKTAVNGGAGAKTQLSSIVVSALTVLTLLFLTGLFEKLPEAVLAAVVIAAVIELVDFRAFERLFRVWTQPLGDIYRLAARADFIAAVGALLGVLFFDTLPGLFIGIGLSMVTLLYRSSRPHVATLVRDHQSDDRRGAWLDAARHPSLTPDPRVVVIRIESGLYFANADYVKDQVLARVTEQTRDVILDAETMPFLDVSGADMLVDLDERLKRRAVTLRIARDTGQVRDVLRTSGRDGAGLPTYRSVDDAYAAADPSAGGAA